jgi:MCP family monocarboxylic acid transporter-like MFS transporter 10
MKPPKTMIEEPITQRRTWESTTDTESACELKQYEGGRAAWCTVAGSILVYYSSFGIMNSFGFFQDYYTRDFLKQTPTSTIAFCGTLQMFLMNALASVSGTLCDRYGIRVITIIHLGCTLTNQLLKYLYIGSGTGTIVALILLSFVQPGHFWQVFLTQGLLMGLSIAFGIQPALTVVSQHFKERRALAMGLVSTGSALGGIGFPLMFGRLLPSVGFANAIRLAALKIG